MPPAASSPVLTSVPASRLEVAAAIETAIELKLDWEDYDVLSGERSVVERLEEENVDPGRVASVHLPPGVRTRGRAIGMAATAANVGSIVDFVHTQLTDLAVPFLVLHPPRSFEYGDQLTLLRTLCDLTGHELSIENPPDRSYWHTPEDIAFFAFVGATYAEWADLYVTIDSAHLPAHRPPADLVDQDAVEDLFERFSGDGGMDLAAVRKAFGGHLTGNVAKYRSTDANRLPVDGWSPLLNALGKLYFTLGELPRTEACHDWSLEKMENVGDTMGQARHEVYVGNIAFERGELTVASDHFQAAVDRFEKIGNNRGLADSYRGLARIAKQLNDYQEAKEYLEMAIEELDDLSADRYKREVIDELIAVCEEGDMPREALDWRRKIR